MDAFDSKEFYGYSLSEDPKLRTTARNYEFKYNSSDNLERIINRVRMERREKAKQREMLLKPRHGKFQVPLLATESSQFLQLPTVETQVGRLHSQETVVKIMSDADIEAMISQTLHATNKLDATTLKTASDVLLASEQTEQNVPTESEINLKEKKTSKLSLERLPIPQPKWVEIKPIQKGFANFLPAVCDDGDLSGCEDMSHLNLSCESINIGESQGNQTLCREHLLDAFSIDSDMTVDYIIRNQDLPEPEEDLPEKEDEPFEETPISLEIEFPLNECEHLEMERVFGRTLPQVSPLDFGKLDSQIESEYSDLDIETKDRKFEEDAASLTDEEFNIQPVVHIQHHVAISSPLPSERSTYSSLPRTSRTINKSSRSPKIASSRSSTVTLATPVEKRLKNQIDTLKQEKMRIFSKMTSIQESIIETLDTLRQSLLKVSMPDGQAEKTFRERNALEFSVRFSRNYLFPLGKMIEKLQDSPKENYHSALTNEPCVKVCGIYGLLSQAVQCYKKQLRHLFTENVPKKLDVLLNMIKDTTTICLEKQIFDKEDTLIQCLLARCEVFLGFVMEFEENKRSARKEESALSSTQRDQFKLPKTSSKWDLTMNLNKFNMYEPKLVQKKPKKNLESKKPKASNSRPTPTPKKDKISSHEYKSHRLVSSGRKDSDQIRLLNEDLIDTQVRKDNVMDSVDLINAVISDQPDSDLANNVIETLQDITKDEVRQIFGPIVSNLDSILKSSDNQQTTVESVFNVLSSQLQQARCKQLKIDAVATEKSTQNGNTYEKGVTKKGTHSSRGEQQRKENRQNKVTKAKATSCSNNNVKEGSTEQTERYNSRGGLTNTICDKQSQRNNNDDDDDVAAVVSENDSVSMKQKTRNGAFVLAATAKKPTPAPVVGGKAAAATAAPPPSLTVLPSVQLDEVMPPPPLQHNRMTSQQCLESTASLITVGVPQTHQPDTFALKQCHQRIGDGGYQTEDAFQRTVRDGAANALDVKEQNQVNRRKNLPAPTSSPVKNGTTMSGQIQHFNYQPNALYTFVKHFEETLPPSEKSQKERTPREITFENKETDMATNRENYETLKTTSDSSLDVQPSCDVQEHLEEATRNNIDIKELLEERQDFIERCKLNPLYSNSEFPQPWKVLSKISNSIAKEIVDSFEKDLSFGEESYVQDFINMEMQT